MVNSGRFQSLQNIDDEENKDLSKKEYEEHNSNEEEMDIGKIYWFKETNLYAHASGIHYDT